MNKVMGIDYGNARIGIAFSDWLNIIANAYEVYHRVDLDTDMQHFADLIKQNSVDHIVIGLPLNMAGEEQEIAQQTREFAGLLKEKFNLPITFIDERLTSSEAEDILKRAGYDWRARKQMLDAVSAQIILQEYLDRK
ncbi:MAG: Holliday junction resolvase RuvX [Clostridia bacterium]